MTDAKDRDTQPPHEARPSPDKPFYTAAPHTPHEGYSQRLPLHPDGLFYTPSLNSPDEAHSTWDQGVTDGRRTFEACSRLDDLEMPEDGWVRLLLETHRNWSADYVEGYVQARRWVVWAGATPRGSSRCTPTGRGARRNHGE